MTDMPTTYETQQQTTTSSSSGFGPHIEYLKTIPGILKIVEIVLSLIVVICIAVRSFYGDGWVWFVSISAFITVLIWFILYFIGVYGRLPAWRGILILSLLTFICAVLRWWGPAQTWVEFVSFIAFISALLFLLLHVFNVISRFPGPWLLVEFIYYCVFTVFYLIAAIVAAARAGQSGFASVGAAAFFAFAATAVFAVDTFFQFRAWRSGQTEMATSTATTTTTTHTHVEQKATY